MSAIPEGLSYDRTEWYKTKAMEERLQLDITPDKVDQHEGGVCTWLLYSNEGKDYAVLVRMTPPRVVDVFARSGNHKQRMNRRSKLGEAFVRAANRWLAAQQEKKGTPDA